jgi:hypothetical protein
VGEIDDPERLLNVAVSRVDRSNLVVADADIAGSGRYGNFCGMKNILRVGNDAWKEVKGERRARLASCKSERDRGRDYRDAAATRIGGATLQDAGLSTR